MVLFNLNTFDSGMCYIWQVEDRRDLFEDDAYDEYTKAIRINARDTTTNRVSVLFDFTISIIFAFSVLL